MGESLVVVGIKDDVDGDAVKSRHVGTSAFYGRQVRKDDAKSDQIVDRRLHRCISTIGPGTKVRSRLLGIYASMVIAVVMY